MLLTNINGERMMMTMRTIGYAGSIYGRYRRHLGLGPHSPISLPIRRVVRMMMMMMMMLIITMIKQYDDFYSIETI